MSQRPLGKDNCMKEAIDVLPQPIVNLGEIDYHGKFASLRSSDNMSVKNKKRLTTKGTSRKHKTLVGGATVDSISLGMTRKVSIIAAESEVDRLSRQDSEDNDGNKSVRSKKSSTMYSSVAKSLR